MVVLAFASLVTVASAESFGPLPGPDQSRCAALRANRRILNIGQTIVLHGGPITDQCGGLPSTTRYAWQSGDPADPSSAPGLTMVHPCASDAPVCIYRAALFTQPGAWQAVGITGTSPDGGWGASVPYAIRYGRYFEVGVTVNGFSNSPRTVTLTGNGRHTTTGPNQGGAYVFDVTRGTYTFSFTLGRKAHHTKVHLSERPGAGTGVNITPP